MLVEEREGTMLPDTDRKAIMMKKSFLYLIGNFSSKIFGTLIIPIYAVYLSAPELGSYDFQFSIGNFLSPIIALAIWESILRFGLGKDGKNLKEVITSGIVISSITLLLSLLILVVSYTAIYGISSIVYLYVSMIILIPVVSICQYIARATNHNTAFVQSSVYASVINLLCLLIFVVYAKGGQSGLLVSTILTSVSNIIFICFKIKIWEYFSLSYLNFPLIKKMLHYSLPLIFNLMFIWMINSFSRFYINLSLGATANGIYAFAAKFSMIVSSISGVVNMAAIEDAVLSVGNKDFIKRFEKNVEEISSLMLDIMIWILPLIGIAYGLISDKAYQLSLPLVPLLMYAVFLQNSASLIGNLFNVYNKTQSIFYTSLIGAVINIVLAIVLNNWLGLIGIVLAQVLGGSGIFISRYLLGNRIKKYSIDWKMICIKTFIYIIISSIILFRNSLVNSILLIIISIFIIRKYKKFILNTISKIKFFLTNIRKKK